MASNSLVELAKKVIREAGKIGLEEAGSRICGPTAWRYVKRILAPVVAELEKRFPRLLLVPEEADRGAEALSADTALQAILDGGFAGLERGQDEILAALAQQDEALTKIGDAINSGFARTDERLGSALDGVRDELAALKLEIVGRRGASAREVVPELSIEEISDQAAKLQSDAMRWVVAGDAATALQRLEEARAKLETGLQQDPDHVDLLVCLGFVQKTQAQVAQLQGDYQAYVQHLADAAKCFAQGFAGDSMNVGALNGIANIYIFDKDYDRAIQIGTRLVRWRPDYGAAAWDLAIALEGKKQTTGQTPELLRQLRSVYHHLKELMPTQPQAFTASDLAHVQSRLTALDK